jgi:hypothetical protein
MTREILLQFIILKDNFIEPFNIYTFIYNTVNEPIRLLST